MLRLGFVVLPVLMGLDKFTDLLTYPGFYDVALRDVGLLVAAVALGLLARSYDRPRTEVAA